MEIEIEMEIKTETETEIKIKIKIKINKIPFALGLQDIQNTTHCYDGGYGVARGNNLSWGPGKSHFMQRGRDTDMGQKSNIKASKAKQKKKRKEKKRKEKKRKRKRKEARMGDRYLALHYWKRLEKRSCVVGPNSILNSNHYDRTWSGVPICHSTN